MRRADIDRHRRPDGRSRSLHGFFNDLDGHTLALMQEAPKGYTPPT